MIKFFRKNRQDLLSKGKIGKYLTYAIGEIILVVVGILIAVGINNWVQTYKTSEKVDQFLIGLQSDLRNDLREIKMVAEGQLERSKTITEVIDLSRKPDVKSIIMEDPRNYFEARGNVTFFPIVGSYNAANNAGLINNINNEELKRSLLNLYEYKYARVSHNGVILDERTGQIEWESRRYVDNTREGYVFDKRAILDKDFVLQLGYLNKFIGFYLMLCNNTKSGIEEVLKQIDIYLHT